MSNDIHSGCSTWQRSRNLIRVSRYAPITKVQYPEGHLTYFEGAGSLPAITRKNEEAVSSRLGGRAHRKSQLVTGYIFAAILSGTRFISLELPSPLRMMAKFQIQETFPTDDCERKIPTYEKFHRLFVTTWTLKPQGRFGSCPPTQSSRTLQEHTGSTNGHVLFGARYVYTSLPRSFARSLLS